MRLLQVSLRTLLLYSLLLVLISIPVSLFSIQTILNEEVDESISAQADQFMNHIKGFEYLDDLETDLEVLDQLSSNIHIRPSDQKSIPKHYETVSLYDSIQHEQRPFRRLSSVVDVKGKSYLLTITVPLVNRSDLILAIALVQLVVSVLLALGLLILNRSLSKKLWKPFYKTLDQLKAYQLDKTDIIPLETSEIQEFDDLNKTVNHLTNRNREVFMQQKEFIENASHELQTPIAIFQSKIDDLMQRPGLTKQEAETILELESTSKRMARLNKNLLLLSKIDNNQFSDVEDIELDELINNHLAVLKPMARLEHISMVPDLDNLSLKANLTLIEILITNLLHNAIRYSLKNEQVHITLKDRTLTITNRGNKLKMDAGKMMERFKKESTDPTSSGLGLAIVKKICERYNYRISYSYENVLHTFKVSF